MCVCGGAGEVGIILLIIGWIRRQCKKCKSK